MRNDFIPIFPELTGNSGRFSKIELAAECLESDAFVLSRHDAKIHLDFGCWVLNVELIISVGCWVNFFCPLSFYEEDTLKFIDFNNTLVLLYLILQTDLPIKNTSL